MLKVLDNLLKKKKKQISLELQSPLASVANLKLQVPTSEPSILISKGSTKGSRDGGRPSTGLLNPISY